MGYLSTPSCLSICPIAPGPHLTRHSQDRVHGLGDTAVYLDPWWWTLKYLACLLLVHVVGFALHGVLCKDCREGRRRAYTDLMKRTTSTDQVGISWRAYVCDASY